MKVSLISFTPEARELLLLTKQTRLSMDAGLMDEIRQWPEEKKQAELRYMLGTIQSSWEFVDYVFSIEGVSRAFTHQLVRSRDNSYAQQSQRTVDMTGFDFVTPSSLSKDQREWYELAMAGIDASYQQLVSIGLNPQDARGVLPTNICTNIIMKANLRSLSHMARVRLCTRTQGEYQQIFRELRCQVLAVHPWAEPFIRVACAADGVCQFPNYQECPIKPGIFNPDSGKRWDEDGDTHNCNEMDKVLWVPTAPMTKDEIQELWEQTNFEAVPKGTGR